MTIAELEAEGYVLATDADFSGQYKYGYIYYEKYIGSDLKVIVPEYIKGELVTSCMNMFDSTNVTAVALLHNNDDFNTVDKTGGNKTAHSGIASKVDGLYQANTANVPNFQSNAKILVTRTVASETGTASGTYTINPATREWENANLQPYVVIYRYRRTA